MLRGGPGVFFLALCAGAISYFLFGSVRDAVAAGWSVVSVFGFPGLVLLVVAVLFPIMYKPGTPIR